MDHLSQKDTPLISVIMPVYNSESFLAEAIESILNQTVRDFEFLIVYDESNDRSLSIIEYYQRQDPRISLINGQKKGLIGALNQGINAVRGEFIARMDADDISLPERFEKQLKLMESARADVCGCHWLVINETGKLTEARIAPLCRDAFTIFLMCAVPFPHGSVMMRTSFIREHALEYGGSKYAECAEDYDLWIKFFENGGVFIAVNEILFKYRDSSASLSKQRSKKIASDCKKIRRFFVRHNQETCLHAVHKLTNNYTDLSRDERDYLLMASYILSVNCKQSIIFNVLKNSSAKNIGLFLFRWLRGI